MAVGTTWDSVVDLAIPRLDLLVDEASGMVRLANKSGTDFDLDFLQLSSASGSLDPGGWNSLAGQAPAGAGWQKNNPSANLLTESNAAGSTKLAAGATLNLGAAFTPGATQDIVARFGTRQGLLNVAPLSQAIEQTFRRGDTDASGIVDISDPIRNLTVQFVGGGAFPCKDAADVDDSGLIDISDPIYNLTHQFVGGIDPPPAPGTQICGPDPTDDELGCESFPVCP